MDNSVEVKAGTFNSNVKKLQADCFCSYGLISLKMAGAGLDVVGFQRVNAM